MPDSFPNILKNNRKPGGILLVNNSHGDAPLAFLDNDFSLTEMVQRGNSRFTFSSDNSHDYFQPTSGKKSDRQEIETTMRRPEYTKTAYAYIFQKH